MSELKNFDMFFNEGLDTESNKKFILANIKGINEKLVREVFAWYIDNICEEDDLQLISTAFKNRSSNIKNVKTNESMVEIEDSEEGVYVLTVHDIHNIVNSFTDTEINEDAIIEELQDYKFVKVDDAEIKVDNEDEIKVDPLYVEDEPVEEVDELSSDDENPTFIKKFEI